MNNYTLSKNKLPSPEIEVVGVTRSNVYWLVSLNIERQKVSDILTWVHVSPQGDEYHFRFEDIVAWCEIQARDCIFPWEEDNA